MEPNMPALPLRCLVLSLCLSVPVATVARAEHLPVPRVGQVDLERYLGDWFLVAHIPTSRDVGAHNAQEHYALAEDGSVAITYRNRLGGFDGKRKLMTPKAYIEPGTGNAVWKVVFGWYWPFRYEYRIAHLEPDYSTVIVARSARDFLWLFSREPQMAEEALNGYRTLAASWGYEVSRMQRVPQQWPNPVDGSTPVREGLVAPP